MEVHSVSPNEVVLRGRRSGIEQKIPKRPNQPGAIRRNEEGEFELDAEETGDVDSRLKIGDTVVTNTEPRGTTAPQGPR
jgi:hypothetical protein